MSGPDFEALLRGVPCKQCTLAYAEHSRFSTHSFVPDFPAMAAAVREVMMEGYTLHAIAAQTERNRAYYHGLVVKIGETLGDDAYIADDGTRAQEVLCAKVPELVDALRAEVDMARSLLKDICEDAMGKGCEETCTYAHAETCRCYSVLNEARARTAEIAALRTQNAEEVTRLRAEVEKEKADHQHTLQASVEMDNALRARLSEARAEVESVTASNRYLYQRIQHEQAEVEKLKRGQATMVRALDASSAEVERLRNHLTNADYACRRASTLGAPNAEWFEAMADEFARALTPPDAPGQG